MNSPLQFYSTSFLSSARNNIADPELNDAKNFDHFPTILESLKPENWAWNFELAEECPVLFSNKNKTALFHPEASFGTTAICGKKTLSSTTIAYWEIHVPALFGSSIMFGVGRNTTKRRLIISFDHLLGASESGDESFGLSHLGILYGGKLNGQKHQADHRYCPELANRPTNIGMLFHGPEGWLEYFVDGQSFGVAFSDIDASVNAYYPMVSSTSQRSQFTLTRQYSIKSAPTLTALCLNQISMRLIAQKLTKPEYLARICELQLPKPLITRLTTIVFEQNNDGNAFNHAFVNRKRKNDFGNVNSVADLLSDFSVDQLSLLWQKVAEIFERFAQPEQYTASKRVRLLPEEGEKD